VKKASASAGKRRQSLGEKAMDCMGWEAPHEGWSKLNVDGSFCGANWKGMG